MQSFCDWEMNAENCSKIQRFLLNTSKYWRNLTKGAEKFVLKMQKFEESTFERFVVKYKNFLGQVERTKNNSALCFLLSLY